MATLAWGLQPPGLRGHGGAFGHSTGTKPERRGNLPEEERPFKATGAKGSKLGAQRPNPVPSQVVSDTSMPKTFKLADFAHTHARTLQTYLLSPAYSERNLWLRGTHVPARWLELGGGPPFDRPWALWFASLHCALTPHPLASPLTRTGDPKVASAGGLRTCSSSSPTPSD